MDIDSPVADWHEQEAQLSPRDRAMRRVSWNLANCNSAETTILEQIEVMKLEG